MRCGTFSHGTLQMADLLAATVDVLDAIAEALTFLPGSDLPHGEIRSAYGALQDRARECETIDPDDGFADDVLTSAWDVADGALALLAEHNRIAPSYLGMHPGDGSDFGIWTREEE